MRDFALLATVALLMGSGVLPASAARLRVTDGWFRALPEGLPAAGYFTLHNDGTQTVSLTGAESKACGMLMLHQSSEQGRMSRMRDVTSVPVPPGASVRFAPGGYHLMCMHPTAEMKPGASVAVTFEFSDGARSTAPFAVRNAKGQ